MDGGYSAGTHGLGVVHNGSLKPFDTANGIMGWSGAMRHELNLMVHVIC